MKKVGISFILFFASIVSIYAQNQGMTVNPISLNKGDILLYQYHAEDQGLANGFTFHWAGMSPRGPVQFREIAWYKGERTKVGVINWEHAKVITDPISDFPYKVGETTGDLDRGDHMYCHYVEKIEDVTVPAGTFKNCFKIVELTCPDDSATWIYPGVGIIKYTYHHHGTITNVVGELKGVKYAN